MSEEIQGNLTVHGALIVGQTSLLQNDVGCYGFFGSLSDPAKGTGGGAVQIGHGFTSPTDNPQLNLTDTISGGSQAQAQISVDGNGTITGITVTNQGSGYYFADIDIQKPTNGANARLYPNISGPITNILILNPGSGYAVGDTISISAPKQGTNFATAQVSSVDSHGKITGITVTAQGDYYDPLYTGAAINNSTGRGAQFQVVVDGRIRAINVVPGYGGVNYTTSDVVTITNSPHNTIFLQQSIWGGVSPAHLDLGNLTAHGNITVEKATPQVALKSTTATDGSILYYDNNTIKMSLSYSAAYDNLFVYDQVGLKTLVSLTHNGDFGAFRNITAGGYFVSNIATGTVPIQVISQTTCTNLSADMLDGQHGTYYQNASNLNSGTVPTARLGSGTASSSTYLRGDSTWASLPTGQWTAGTVTVVASPLFIGTDSRLYMSQAGSGGTGYLTSTDWNTFNNKYGSGSAPSFSGISLSGNIIPTVVGTASNGYYCGSYNFPWKQVYTYALVANAINTISGGMMQMGANLNFLQPQDQLWFSPSGYTAIAWTYKPAENKLFAVWNGSMWKFHINSDGDLNCTHDIYPGSANNGNIGSFSNYWGSVCANYLCYGTTVGHYFDEYDDLAIVKQWGEEKAALPATYDQTKIKPPTEDPFAILRSEDETGQVQAFYDVGKMQSFALGCAKALARKHDEHKETISMMHSEIEQLREKVSQLEAKLAS